MAARSWQETLTQQAEEVSARLRDVLSTGVGLLRTELGLELAGLDPQSLPTWLVLLSTATLGLLLAGLLWAAACGGSARRKRPRSFAEREEAESGLGLTVGGGAGPNTAAPGAAALLLLKSEDQKKRNKKRLVEKAGRVSDAAGGEHGEGGLEMRCRGLGAKLLIILLILSIKKSKGDTKTAQDLSRLDGKEVDEGAWETKISNREKRQQRKRDKVLTDTGSGEFNLPGIENAVTVATEQLVSTTPFPVAPRKNKGDTILNAQISNSKPGKGDSTLQQVSSGMNESPTVNGGSWNEKSVKITSQMGAGEEKWSSVTAATGKRKAETSAWGQDTGDTNGKDWGASLVGRTWGERTLFSGIDGRSSTDPNSDWNAPAEEWGNWIDEEKAASSGLQPEEPLSDIQKVSEDEKEKEDTILQSTTSGKSKKKKKKKKKQEEASSPAQDAEDLEREGGEEFQEDTSKAQPQQEIAFSLKTISTSEPAEVRIKCRPPETPSFAVSTEPSVIVSESDSDKIPSQVPQMLQETDVSSSNSKQNSVPPPQTKSEDSWESPKQVKKKKKARRET
uniref:Metadherin n=1 Tax=Sphenodon punctatus TaxID=8508 RepID=A0A8D0H294_SPHPU